jgi:tetratricopeptide (TPR) repeat protein
MKKILLALLAIGAFSTANAQGLKLPALSPGAKISQDFSTSNIDISYSRPSMRGRLIFGDLVPYDKVWRTGANSATKIKIGEDLEIGGQQIKAGEYALYTIPGKTEWEIILNKGTGNWGAYGYSTSDDVARFKVKSKMLDKNVQSFTINITNITYNSCKLEMEWEKTKVVIPIIAHNEERLNTSIDKAINNPEMPYFQAANYYYETNQNLDKAKIYVDKSVDANPKAYYMWLLKARIEKKLGHKEDAKMAANKAIETAKGTSAEDEYKHNGEKLIAEL